MLRVDDRGTHPIQDESEYPKWADGFVSVSALYSKTVKIQ